MSPEFLNGLPEIINKVFDVLELLVTRLESFVVRLALLGLAALGAYDLFKHYF